VSDAQQGGEKRYTPGHLAALRRFAVGITVLTVVGHAFLGFEQSYAQPLVALATGYGMQLLLEALDAWCGRRRPRFAGGLLKLVDFLLSAHISALAVAMMLYFNDRLWVVAFAAAVAVGSKTIFRAPVGGQTRHFFNPSNFGISVTLLLCPQVGLAMPWQFTAALTGVGDWLLPALIICVGSFLNGWYTKRVPLLVAFLVGFVVQALVRSLVFQASLLPMLAAATGMAAVIYTFFMLPDPATTPDRAWAQVVFGAAVAAVYLTLVALHIPFGLFLGLTIVCGARGLLLYFMAFRSRRPAVRPDLAKAAAPAAEPAS
jgi:enediyne biosynthesis protein E5